MARQQSPTLDDSTFWEKVATTRWGAYITEVERRAILKAHESFSTPTTALEVGAEGGRWSTLLTDLGWRMTCTDVDEKALAACQERIPTANCILVKPDDRRLPCDSESVDMLLCIEVAPVIQSDWFASEAYRVLANDGVVVGVFWNLLSFRGFLAHARSSLAGRFDFYKRSYPAWRREFTSGGFSVVYEEGYCWFPFSRASDSKFVPAFVRIERWFRLRRLISVSPWIVFIAKKSS